MDSVSYLVGPHQVLLRETVYKEDMLHENLITDLIRIAKEAVKKRGRRLSWLRFAQRRTPKGYAFVLDREAPWEVLHEIVTKAASLHPHYSFAVVVDIASELFNQEEKRMSFFQPVY